MLPSAVPRARCWRCLRPRTTCLCGDLPRVETRTRLLILQHPRERMHALGTARIVGLSLPQAEIHVADRGGLHRPLAVPDDAAVLFPHADAADLAALAPAARPSTLVVLDGTWAHARRLYRENPWLARLRHVRLHPREPSRYRIRREPRADYVSTVEAVVAALRLLEPDTEGLDGLLTAFERMIDRQVAFVDAAVRRGRCKLPRQRPSRRLSPLLGSTNLLVVYAESSLPGGDTSACRELVQWTAARVDTGEVFEALLRPAGAGPTAHHLGHMRLLPGAVHGGEELAAARTRFAAFAGADAALAAWSPSTLLWGRALGGGVFAPDLPCTVLKTGYCNLRNGAAGVLDDVVRREGLPAAALPCSGRAAERLGNALAVARWLRAQRAERLAAGLR